jgi:hypothetical protein
MSITIEPVRDYVEMTVPPPRLLELRGLADGSFVIITEHEAQRFVDQETTAWVLRNLMHPAWRVEIAGRA